jgi:hypothetical protein
VNGIILLAVAAVVVWAVVLTLRGAHIVRHEQAALNGGGGEGE